jgi:membrane protease YdiL (CAAX protease family)
MGVCGGACLQLKDLVTEPVAQFFWKQPERSSSVLTGIQHNPLTMFKSLVIVWAFAALGEELGYRALLLRRAADALNGSLRAYAVAVIVSSVLFGLGHFYKGPTGVFDSTISGLILAGIYLITRRNIWAPVLAHGISDTFAVVFTYFSG